ncbi:MAG: hypothetical protein AVO39_03105 [delta proteobacterium MLS_D]|nr:MAG: hypothetical protein AVO39_03105 [delta proteobacterium MLS_D]
MKRLLIGILALGLVIAFAAPAAAADVKVSGEYKIQGFYINNQALQDPGNTSDAFYTQRLRVATTFAVNQRLMINTRFDAMEGVMGAGDGLVYDPAGVPKGTPGAAEETNIDIDYVNMTILSNCGKFDIGYLRDGVYGTGFGDAEIFVPKASWTLPIKGTKFINFFQVKKMTENDWNTLNNATDLDEDRYMWIGMYLEKTWQAALLLQYHRTADNRQLWPTIPAAGFENKQELFLVSPYFKGTFGDLYLEAQVYWFAMGDLEWENNTAAAAASRAGAGAYGQDMDVEGLSYYIKAQYDLGPAYVGALYGMATGDDPNDITTAGGALSGGADWDPMLILWNSELAKWGGAMGPAAGNQTGDTMSNASLFQLFAGYQVNKDLEIFASYGFAKADEVAAGTDDSIGNEFDLKATYKMFENLEYEVAFGYFWSDDWYKAGAAVPQVDDNYLLFHKLTLNF